MNAVEAVAALAVAGWLAAAAHQAGAGRQEAALAGADARAVLALAAAYRATACARGVTRRRADVVANELRNAGIRMAAPSDAASWEIRYPARRAAPRLARPIYLSGTAVSVVLNGASDTEKRVVRSMGGRVVGVDAVLTAARPPAGRHRFRRARLARGATPAGRASSC